MSIPQPKRRRRNLMFLALVALLAVMFFSCSTYNPLNDRSVYPTPLRAGEWPGVKVTFLGNTTILISDETTHLMVDGFFSRPGALKTLFGKIAPDEAIITQQVHQLRLTGITNLDALLIGHAHHDHALDAPEVARQTSAKVMGSTSYGFIHEGAGLGKGQHIVVSSTGAQQQFGKFSVTFRPSRHVGSHSWLQRKVEGEITAPMRTPTDYSSYKHGDVFALHIAHPDGNIAITTTAGAQAGQFKDLKADVVLLGIGLLAKEAVTNQNFYWEETVETLRPHTVVPIHWDSFTRKLDDGLAPSPLLLVDDAKGAMDIVKRKAAGRTVRVMNLRDSFLLRDGVMQ